MKYLCNSMRNMAFIVFLCTAVIVTSYYAEAQSKDVRGIIAPTVDTSEKNTASITEKKPLTTRERNAAKQRFLRDMSVVFDYVFDNYYVEPDPQKMIEGSLSGMMSHLGDPYSTFITPEEAKDYSENIAGEFGGLGIRIDVGIDTETTTQFIKVIAPIRNTPAERLGITSGDLITAVDDTSLAGYSTRDAVKIMRGKPGTQVTLTVKRGSHIFPVTITREIINNIEISYDFIDDDIAYMKIDSFSQDLPKDFLAAIREVNKKNYKTIIIDLRNNPGGSLNSVVNIADAFLKKGLIVGTKSRDGSADKKYFSTDDTLVDMDKKVVVIVNKGSASASEIFSGAIKDRKRGTIVGSTTFGKGLVQAVNGFEAGFISLTISQYYTPAGNFINGKGIDPMVEIAPDVDFADLDARYISDLQTLSQENLALYFVEKNQDLSPAKQLVAFREEIKKRNLDIDDYFLKQRLHFARNRVNNIIENFNIDVDEVLRETVDMIHAGKL